MALVLAVRLYGRHLLATQVQRLEEEIGTPDFESCFVTEPTEQVGGSFSLLETIRSLELDEAELKDIDQALHSAALSDLVLSEPRGEALRSVLTRNEDSLALLHRLPDRADGSIRALFAEFHAHDQWEAVRLVDAARLLAAEARVALANGDEPRFRGAVSGLAALTARVQSLPDMLSVLLGGHLETLLLGVLAESVQHRPADLEASEPERWIPSADLSATFRHSVVCDAEAARRLFSGQEGVGPYAELDIGRERWKTRLELWLLGDYYEASALETPLRLAGMTMRPYGARRNRPEDERRASFPLGLLSNIVLPNIENTLDRTQAVLSQRRLARIALALVRYASSQGRYPESLDHLSRARSPDPFTGGSLSYELLDEGGARVSVEGGMELFREMHRGRARPATFTWKLPAPLS